MSQHSRRSLAPLAWLALGTFTVAAADDRTEQRIRGLDAELLAAMAARDAATVDRMLLDDFVLITSGGRVRSKQDVIAEISSPEVVLEVNSSRDVHVRVHGDTAVLTGVLYQKGTEQGQPFAATVLYTDTWVLDGGEWRQLSGHASRAAQAQ